MGYEIPNFEKKLKRLANKKGLTIAVFLTNKILAPIYFTKTRLDGDTTLLTHIAGEITPAMTSTCFFINTSNGEKKCKWLGGASRSVLFNKASSLTHRTSNITYKEV